MGPRAPSFVLGPSKALPFPVCKPQQDMHHSRRPRAGRPERGDSRVGSGKECLFPAPAARGRGAAEGSPQTDMGKDKQGPQTPRKGWCGGSTRRLNRACLCNDCASRCSRPSSRPSTRCCQGGWDHASSGRVQVCAWTLRRGPPSSQSRPRFAWELHSEFQGPVSRQTWLVGVLVAFFRSELIGGIDSCSGNCEGGTGIGRSNL